jgi:hypothetical protein
MQAYGWRFGAFISALDEEGLIDWEECFAGGSFAPAKKGALASERPSAAGRCGLAANAPFLAIRLNTGAGRMIIRECVISCTRIERYG